MPFNPKKFQKSMLYSLLRYLIMQNLKLTPPLLAKIQNRQEQMFLFTKILENAKELLKSMKIFDESDLKILIESYALPSFKYDYMARRSNIVEYYFLDKPLTINKLKWVA